jgi:hypothetical protein
LIQMEKECVCREPASATVFGVRRSAICGSDVEPAKSGRR